MDVKPRILSTAIDIENATASIELALSVAEYFELKPSEARDVVAEVALVIAKWRDEAKKAGIPDSEITRMSSAFDHEDLTKAFSLSTSAHRGTVT